MQWTVAREKDLANETLEKRLLAAADQFLANSGPTDLQYPAPVLGLIPPCFAEVRFDLLRAALDQAGASSRGSRRMVDPTALPL